jgi:hypothetical protein
MYNEVAVVIGLIVKMTNHITLNLLKTQSQEEVHHKRESEDR